MDPTVPLYIADRRDIRLWQPDRQEMTMDRQSSEAAELDTVHSLLTSVADNGGIDSEWAGEILGKLDLGFERLMGMCGKMLEWPDGAIDAIVGHIVTSGERGAIDRAVSSMDGAGMVGDPWLEAVMLGRCRKQSSVKGGKLLERNICLAQSVLAPESMPEHARKWAEKSGVEPRFKEYVAYVTLRDGHRGGFWPGRAVVGTDLFPYRDGLWMDETANSRMIIAAEWFLAEYGQETGGRGKPWKAGWRMAGLLSGVTKNLIRSIDTSGKAARTGHFECKRWNDRFAFPREAAKAARGEEATWDTMLHWSMEALWSCEKFEAITGYAESCGGAVPAEAAIYALGAERRGEISISDSARESCLESLRAEIDLLGSVDERSEFAARALHDAFSRRETCWETVLRDVEEAVSLSSKSKRKRFADTTEERRAGILTSIYTAAVASEGILCSAIYETTRDCSDAAYILTCARVAEVLNVVVEGPDIPFETLVDAAKAAKGNDPARRLSLLRVADMSKGSIDAIGVLTVADLFSPGSGEPTRRAAEWVLEWLCDNPQARLRLLSSLADRNGTYSQGAGIRQMGEDDRLVYELIAACEALES